MDAQLMAMERLRWQKKAAEVLQSLPAVQGGPYPRGLAVRLYQSRDAADPRESKQDIVLMVLPHEHFTMSALPVMGHSAAYGQTSRHVAAMPTKPPTQLYLIAEEYIQVLKVAAFAYEARRKVSKWQNESAAAERLVVAKVHSADSSSSSGVRVACGHFRPHHLRTVAALLEKVIAIDIAFALVDWRSPSDVDQLTQFLTQPTVTSLKMRHLRLEDLLVPMGRSLTEFMRDCRVLGRWTDGIRQSPRWLRTLSLQDCGLTDDMVVDVFRHGVMMVLQRVNLSGNCLSDGIAAAACDGVGGGEGVEPTSSPCSMSGP